MDEQASKKELYCYIGTYTEPLVSGTDTVRPGKGEGIYLCKINLGCGSLALCGVFGNIKNPSYLAVAPSGRFLFCVNEVSDYYQKPALEGGKQNIPSGSISSFAIEQNSGKLRFISVAATQGSDPCYICINKEESHAFVSNYSSGNIALFPFTHDGVLQEASCVIQHQGKGTHPVRQEGPHAHSVFLDNENKILFASDLGLDKIFAYHADYMHSKLILEDKLIISLAPGSGPRHCVFNCEGSILYVMNELNLAVSVYSYDKEKKAFSLLQNLRAIKKENETDSGADIGIHPNGKWLYASIRGLDIILTCEIDPVTKTLKYLSKHTSGGKTPRNFLIEPTGRYLLAGNQDSGAVVLFSIDQENGSLSEVSRLEIPNPVCIKPVWL